MRNKNAQKQETELANKEPNIKSRNNWEPKRNHHTAETFIEAVNKDIVERFSDKNKLSKNTLTDTDKNAIEHFYSESRQRWCKCYYRLKRLYFKG